MPALLQQGTGSAEVEAAKQIIQFAAVLLEMGGAVLIAALFAAAARSPLRRSSFSTWTLAWGSMALAIISVCARYFLLAPSPAATLPEHAASVRFLYWLYEIGKFSYWVLIWRGAVEYAAPAGPQMNRWRWKGIAA